ncbi:MAG: ribonuclease HII [Patescibacteria group bacterium]
MKFPRIRKPRRLAFAEEFRFVGLDEAGRGPVIGPMVIAICALTHRDRRWCVRHNVTDSKKIPAKRRYQLADALRDRCWHKVAVIHPPEIDEAVKNRRLTLNGLEIKYMSRLIEEFLKDHPNSPAQIMLDSPVRKTNNFRNLISHLSGWNDLESLKAENKADLNYRHVGAASIIAKTIRDAHIKKINYLVNCNVGSGYCSDPLTKKFIAAADSGNPHIRWSWATAQKSNNDSNNQPIDPLF